MRRSSQAQLCCRREGCGWLLLTAHPSVSAAEIEEYVTRTDGKCVMRGPGPVPHNAGRKPVLVQDLAPS